MGQHSGTYRGKRVYVKLKNGISFDDKYMESSNKRIRFQETGWIWKSQIITFSIYRSHTLMS